MIGKVSEQPPADRAHDKTDCEEDRGVQLLYDRIVTWEKRCGEVKGECRVDVEVVPLDKIADRTDKNRLDASPDVGKLQTFVFQRDCRGSHSVRRIRRPH